MVHTVASPLRSLRRAGVRRYFSSHSDPRLVAWRHQAERTDNHPWDCESKIPHPTAHTHKSRWPVDYPVPSCFPDTWFPIRSKIKIFIQGCPYFIHVINLIQSPHHKS